MKKFQSSEFHGVFEMLKEIPQIKVPKLETQPKKRSSVQLPFQNQHIIQINPFHIPLPEINFQYYDPQIYTLPQFIRLPKEINNTTQNLNLIKEYQDTPHQQLQKTLSPQDKILDYLLLIDFECTCDENETIEIQEIIEFPIFVVDTHTKMIVNTFHSFVKPTINPQLTEFCQKLTGIKQEQVEKSNTLDFVLKAVDFFLKPYLNHEIAIVNDCGSDMKRFLFRETQYKKIQIQDYMKSFINLKKIFPIQENNNQRVRQINQMLQCLGMEFQGKRHQGIIDAKNLSKVVINLLKKGYYFTTQLKESIYPQNFQNQKFQFLLLFTAFTEQNNINEFSCTLFDLAKNQIIWNTIYHHVYKQDLTQKQKILDTIQQISRITTQLESNKKKFCLVSMGSQIMNILKKECQKLKIQIPSFLNQFVNLKKMVPELKKMSEKKINQSQMIQKTVELFNLKNSIDGEIIKIRSSLDDSLRMAQIIKQFIEKGENIDEKYIQHI